MALDPTKRAAVEAEAKRRGADPAAAVAEAERISTKTPSPAGANAPAETGKPVADRLLIGFLPFITVRELRTEWLGLTDSVPDDGMMCGDFAAKHGGGPSGPAPTDGGGQ